MPFCAFTNSDPQSRLVIRSNPITPPYYRRPIPICLYCIPLPSVPREGQRPLPRIAARRPKTQQLKKANIVGPGTIRVLGETTLRSSVGQEKKSLAVAPLSLDALRLR
jgi:hypothetical protein